MMACSNGSQQGNAFETVRFAVTTFPLFGRVFALMLLAQGPPSVMMFVSLHRFQKVWLLLLSSNRYSSKISIKLWGGYD